MVEAAAAFVAWLGVSMIVLADGRRGLGLGVALAGLGLAAIVFQGHGLVAAAALAVGAAIAAARRLVSGSTGWQIMPPGSTPRLVLCIGAGLLALWIGFGITTGTGAALRFAVMSVVGLAGARVLASDDPAVLLTAVALLALAIAAAAGLSHSAPGMWPYVAAGLIAAAVGWLPVRTPDAA